MKLDAFLLKLRDHPNSVTLDEALATIKESYDFMPTGYTNGGARFEPGTSDLSCQIFAFGLLNGLTEERTLQCFGAFYRDDVLKHPQGTDHETIRRFLKHGWAGLKHDSMPLKPRTTPVKCRPNAMGLAVSQSDQLGA